MKVIDSVIEMVPEMMSSGIPVPDEIGGKMIGHVSSFIACNSISILIPNSVQCATPDIHQLHIVIRFGLLVCPHWKYELRTCSMLYLKV